MLPKILWEAALSTFGGLCSGLTLKKLELTLNISNDWSKDPTRKYFGFVDG
jgi:hypothetical protein